MGRPHPIELRSRVVDYVEQGHSRRSAARHFRVSVRFVCNMVILKQMTGCLDPKPQGRQRGTAGKLLPHMDFLSEVVHSEPDITLHELSAALEQARGIKVHFTAVHYALVRLGLSYKKKA